MRQELIPHPDSGSTAARSISVSVLSRGAELELEYRLSGDFSQLVIPPAAAPERADQLWKHTCFEAFIGAAGSPSYCEFNVAPSCAWAAYRFAGYRTGMAALDPSPVVRLERLDGGPDLRLLAVLDLNRVPGIRADADLRLGFSAVIEEKTGRLSYWALKHPPGKPDFHHPDCFAFEIPAAMRS